MFFLPSIITFSAHCFVAETLTGIERVPEKMFEIMVGKYERDYHATEISTQSFKPLKIQIHQAYYGYTGNYDVDIAVLTLDQRIQYMPHILPVCLDMDLKTLREKQPPPTGTMGIIAGYG